MHSYVPLLFPSKCVSHLVGFILVLIQQKVCQEVEYFYITENII